MIGLLISAGTGLVFTLLLSVYIGLLCNHGDDEHGPAEAHH